MSASFGDSRDLESPGTIIFTNLLCLRLKAGLLITWYHVTEIWRLHAAGDINKI